MFALELDGLDDASARLEAYPAALAAALDAKAAELAAALVDLVQNDKLSGGVLNMRSGALRDSIAAEHLGGSGWTSLLRSAPKAT